MQGVQRGESQALPEVPSDRRENNRHRLKHLKFQCIHHFLTEKPDEHQSMLAREVVELFNPAFSLVLGHLELTLLGRGDLGVCRGSFSPSCTPQIELPKPGTPGLSELTSSCTSLASSLLMQFTGFRI